MQKKVKGNKMNKNTITTEKESNISKELYLNYIDSLEKVSDTLYEKFPDTSFIISGNTSKGSKNIYVDWHDDVSINDVINILSVFSSSKKSYLDNKNNVTTCKSDTPVIFDIDDIIIRKTFSQDTLEEIKDNFIKSKKISSNDISIVHGNDDKVGYTFLVKMKEKFQTSINTFNNAKKLNDSHISELIVNEMFNFSN